tara:strand:+ start:1991 stop:2512 length:522 start_codon:yes stop_codon:yes gene_type:complete
MNKKLYTYYIYLYSLYLYYKEKYIYVSQNSIDEIDTNLYVGDIYTAMNKDYLKQHNFKNIISALEGFEGYYSDEFNYVLLELIDNDQQYIIDNFDKTNKFIQDSIDNNEKILIHCVCGVSRSVTILAAYFIYTYKMTPEQAIDKIQKKRSVANPNNFFRQQLQDYYNLLYNKL